MNSPEAIVAPAASQLGRPLPRGRHGIPRDLVAANQRDRILAATASIIGEQGYASLIVADVIAQAGVSRATFYKLYDDKHECVLAAQRWAFDRLRRAVVGAARPIARTEGNWPQAVAIGVGTALDFAAEFPGQARLVLASSYSPSEPKLARDGLALHLQLVQLLHEGSLSFPGTRSPSELTENAAIGAAMSIVGTCLAAEDLDALPGLREDLIQIVLMPYLGGNEARRVAEAA